MKALARERVNYDLLVTAGCLPWYPLDQMEDVVIHPEKHMDILSPWTTREGDGVVYYKQLCQWKAFRNQQKVLREQFALSTYQEHCETLLQDQNVTQKFKLSEQADEQSPWTTWMEYLADLSWTLSKDEEDVEYWLNVQTHDLAKLRNNGVFLAGTAEEDLQAQEKHIDDTVKDSHMRMIKKVLLCGYRSTLYSLDIAKSRVPRSLGKFEGSLKQLSQLEEDESGVTDPGPLETSGPRRPKRRRTTNTAVEATSKPPPKRQRPMPKRAPAAKRGEQETSKSSAQSTPRANAPKRRAPVKKGPPKPKTIKKGRARKSETGEAAVPLRRSARIAAIVARKQNQLK